MKKKVLKATEDVSAPPPVEEKAIGKEVKHSEKKLSYSNLSEGCSFYGRVGSFFMVDPLCNWPNIKTNNLRLQQKNN